MRRSNQRGVYTTEQKWHGSDKNWNGSNSFCKETVKFYPFRVGSTGAYGPVTERIKLHCFYAKTIGTVPVFVGSVPFLLCRVNALQLSYEATDVGSWSLFFVSSNEPVKNGCEVIYEMFSSYCLDCKFISLEMLPNICTYHLRRRQIYSVVKAIACLFNLLVWKPGTNH